MANLRRLIDLDKIKPIEFPSTEMDGLDVVRYLNTLPTVDAVEVVRCKDCKHWDEYHMGSLDGPGTGMGVCLEGCNWVDGKRADDFCSYGERKTDG